MHSNSRVFILSAGLVLLIAAFSFVAGVGAAPFIGRITPHAGSLDGAPEFGKISEIYGILKYDYVDKDTLDPKTLSQGAIKGMIATLNDQFTNYLDADHYKAEMEYLGGKFEGIGAHVGLENSKVVIIAPMPGSPAEKSGMRSGDIVVKVDGQSVEGLGIDEVVNRIRGPKDTTVKVEVLHKGETAPVELEIVRAEIEVATVSSKMVDDVAVITISSFSESTGEELKSEIRKLQPDNPRAIILDLRFNPGGLLDAVVSVAGNFLKDGDVILHTVDSDKNKVTTKAQSDGIFKDVPMVVLINEYSASGSEVLSGALQDNKRAVLMGTDSFGKGAVNIIRPLSDGSALVVTTARWLTPNGRHIGAEKIKPDVEVKPTPDSKEDVQLQAALDYLRPKVPALATS